MNIKQKASFVVVCNDLAKTFKGDQLCFTSVSGWYHFNMNKHIYVYLYSKFQRLRRSHLLQEQHPHDVQAVHLKNTRCCPSVGFHKSGNQKALGF